MKIDTALASRIARSAIWSPHRQIDVMTTAHFSTWLQDRGLGCPNVDWRTLHFLWASGIQRSIAVQARTPEELYSIRPLIGNRLIEVPDVEHRSHFDRLLHDFRGVRVFADTGTAFDSDSIDVNAHVYTGHFSNMVLWHPFQLHNLGHTDLSSLDRSIQGLGPTSPESIHRGNLDAFVYASESPKNESFARLLFLLLSVEPLVHTIVFPTVKVNSPAFDVVDYLEWHREQDGPSLLAESGLTLDDAIAWHEELSMSAIMCDPVAEWRKLLRHADRKKRDLFKGDALRAHSLYDHAEILRRYLEQYHGRTLPDEADIDQGPWADVVNHENYGTTRPGDFHRRAFRRIAREFGVDPGVRLVCFVEGDTEEAFLRHWFRVIGANLDALGIRIENLHGNGGVRNKVWLDLLHRLQEEEVFVVVWVDEDRPEKRSAVDRQRSLHLEKLKELRENGVLTVDFQVWKPNFVEHNFKMDEVYDVVEGMLHKQGFDVTFPGESFAHNPSRTVEEDLEVRARQLMGRRVDIKGTHLGIALAEWASTHRPPPEIANLDLQRPFVAASKLILRVPTSDYPLSLEAP